MKMHETFSHSTSIHQDVTVCNPSLSFATDSELKSHRKKEKKTINNEQ